jgi:hypothetical protein
MSAAAAVLIDNQRMAQISLENMFYKGRAAV